MVWRLCFSFLLDSCQVWSPGILSTMCFLILGDTTWEWGCFGGAHGIYWREEKRVFHKNLLNPLFLGAKSEERS